MKLRKLTTRALALVVLVLSVPLVGRATAAPAPHPVIVVGGTIVGHPLADVFYAPLAERLRADGHPAYIFGLPGGGTGDIAETSVPLVAFVDRVLAETGAAKVSLIGHSQGGLVGRYYIKELGGAAKVDTMMSIGAPHYGTTAANAATLLGLGNCLGFVACQQMARGSAFLEDLNAGDDTIGDVRYANFVTIFDELATPYTTGFLRNDGNNTNVTIQAQCPLRFVEHGLLALDGTVYSGFRDALAHERITLDCRAR